MAEGRLPSADLVNSIPRVEKKKHKQSALYFDFVFPSEALGPTSPRELGSTPVFQPTFGIESPHATRFVLLLDQDLDSTDTKRPVRQPDYRSMCVHYLYAYGHPLRFRATRLARPSDLPTFPTRRHSRTKNWKTLSRLFFSLCVTTSRVMTFVRRNRNDWPRQALRIG